MQLAKEAELIAISNVGIVFIHWPEEAIVALVTGIESIAHMSTQRVLASAQMRGHIIRCKLYSSVVVGPTGI
jgi:hypothetical protein